MLLYYLPISITSFYSNPQVGSLLIPNISNIAIVIVGTKNNNDIELSAANSFAVTNMDTTNYSLLRGETINNASGTNALICGSGFSNFITENMPNNHYLNISSINGTNNTGVKQTIAGVFDLSAMWLE